MKLVLRLALLCVLAPTLIPTEGEAARRRYGVFGLYPNCIAPAVPLEVHSWWWESPTEDVPWHLHIASCVPNARTADCSDGTNPILSVPLVTFHKVTLFANPLDTVDLVRYSWQSSVKETTDPDFSCPLGSGTPVGPGGEEQCSTVVPLTLNPALGNGGLDELRLTANIGDNSIGQRQFNTLNYQVCTGTGSNGYRSRPDPIGRSWYTDFEYSNVRVNYMDFFTSNQERVPTVSGTITLDIDHQQGHAVNTSALWMDQNFHLNPEVFKAANVPPVGGQDPVAGGWLLYLEAGLFDGTFDWDTTTLPDGSGPLCDGEHSLYFQTQSDDGTGMNAGALKLIFVTANGNPPC